MDGWTDPILLDASGRGRASNNVIGATNATRRVASNFLGQVSFFLELGHFDKRSPTTWEISGFSWKRVKIQF